MNTRIQQAEVILKEEQLMFDYPEIAEKILEITSPKKSTDHVADRSFKRLSNSALHAYSSAA